MNENEYLNQITVHIASAIAQQNPIIKIENENVFSVISNFLSTFAPEIGSDMMDASVDRYVAKILKNAKALDPSFLNADPYIQRVRFNTIQSGRFLLTSGAYEKGEILQYAFPRIEQGVYIPCLGYFTKKTNFPTIYEGKIPWMSVIPSEINTMIQPLEEADGTVLVLGLGLGYYPYMAARKKNVRHLTIIEKSDEVIQLFLDSIYPQFESAVQNKITVIHADAHAYMKQVKEEDYDMVFADLWQGAADGHAWYEELHPYETILRRTKFQYWIEEYIHD